MCRTSMVEHRCMQQRKKYSKSIEMVDDIRGRYKRERQQRKNPNGSCKNDERDKCNKVV